LNFDEVLLALCLLALWAGAVYYAVKMCGNLYCAALSSAYSGFWLCCDILDLLLHKEYLFPFGSFETIIVACEMFVNAGIIIFSIKYILWYIRNWRKKEQG